MLVREYLQIVVESAYGVPKASPAAGVDSIVVRLDEGNNYTMEPQPVTKDVMHGGGLAVKGDTVSSKTELKGALKVKLCYSQAAIILGLGAIPVDATPLPFATTEPVGDLASVSIYHAIYQDDSGTFARVWHAGVKCTGGKVEVSEEGQIMQVSLDLQGSAHHPNEFGDAVAITTTLFPAAEAEGAYPTDYVLFTHSSAGLSVNGGAARVFYWDLAVAFTNKCEASWFANRFVKRIRCYGRDVSLDSTMMLMGTPDDLTPFRTVAGFALSVVFTNTTNTISFLFQGNNRVKGCPYDLSNEKAYRRKFNFENRFDKATGKDFVLTVA